MSMMPLRLDGYTDLPAGKLANVVTYLERTVPPDAAAPSPAGTVVRHVTRPDPDWYRALFRRVGEDWLWTSVLLLPDAELAARIGDPAVEIHVIERDGDAIGFAELDLSEAGSVEIVLFGIVPEATGTGVAHILMDAMLRRAFTSGRRVWLHTCSFDDPRAVPFYRRAGFTAYKFAIEVMDDPRLSGLVPETAAPHIPFVPRPPASLGRPVAARRVAESAWWHHR